ncbi:hypothetical protein QUF76_11135 [Desulfobacterales bacterium HSG16]|nr:hypothetical protein [Desulfobacterales bacterium HSG16]
MINFKQQELIDDLMDRIKAKYPEVELIEIAESPEDPESLWVKVTAPDDEDREIEMRQFGNERAFDILLDYGYHMMVMPMQGREKAA